MTERMKFAIVVLGYYEGEKLVAYLLDGKWHVGIGHNLMVDQTPEELEAMGITELPETLTGFSITKEQSDDLFGIDLNDAIDDLSPAFTPKEIAALDDTRAVVLISMAFQMGGRGVRKFKNFIAAVKRRDWHQAHLEMLYADPETKRPSAWYLDTPERCKETAEAMLTGVWKRFEQKKVTVRVEHTTDDVPENLAEILIGLQQDVNGLDVRVRTLEEKSNKKLDF